MRFADTGAQLWRVAGRATPRSDGESVPGVIEGVVQTDYSRPTTGSVSVYQAENGSISVSPTKLIGRSRTG